MVEHGTATGWRYYACRCSRCHQALLAEGKVEWAMRQVRRGRDPATRISAGSARQRLAQLEAAGLTRSAIAAKAGLSNATISRLADPSTQRVSRITASSVLSVVVPVSAQGDDLAAGWVALAACHGRTQLFYAEDPFSQRLAVTVCRRCPVREDCLTEVQALEQPGVRFGVRAGFTAAERREWRR